MPLATLLQISAAGLVVVADGSVMYSTADSSWSLIISDGCMLAYMSGTKQPPSDMEPSPHAPARSVLVGCQQNVRCYLKPPCKGANDNKGMWANMAPWSL